MQGKVQVGGRPISYYLRRCCLPTGTPWSVLWALERQLGSCTVASLLLALRFHSVDPPLDSRFIDRANPLRGEEVLVYVLFWSILFPLTREISSGGDEASHVQCALLSVLDCVLCLFLGNEYSYIELNSVWWLTWTLNLLYNIRIKFTVSSPPRNVIT